MPDVSVLPQFANGIRAPAIGEPGRMGHEFADGERMRSGFELRLVWGTANHDLTIGERRQILLNRVTQSDLSFLDKNQGGDRTDSQCSVRRGLSPRCWCALSGALGRLSPEPSFQSRALLGSG